MSGQDVVNHGPERVPSINYAPAYRMCPNLEGHKHGHKFAVSEVVFGQRSQTYLANLWGCEGYLGGLTYNNQ